MSEISEQRERRRKSMQEQALYLAQTKNRMEISELGDVAETPYSKGVIRLAKKLQQEKGWGL